MDESKSLERNLRVLEMDKVLERLAAETGMPDAADKARRLRPASRREDVEALLGQTADAYAYMARFGAPSFGQAKNMNNSLTRAEMGGVLTMGELLDIGELLRVIRSLVEWRERADAGNPSNLDGFFEMLSPNKYFEEKIFSCIRSEEEMDDHASPALADIRRKKRAAALSVRDRLDKMIKSPSYTKYLQDALVTIRDGRFVVPVKAEHKGEIPGLVHDTSASGATLFIEPMPVVEANNELKVLESKEKEEIDRILAELSAEAGGFAESVKDSYAAAVELNLIFAKARLAYNMRASVPALNEKGEIFLKRARHPLLDPKKVVPITLSLGESYDTLVITGPNTGGKTVTLKTIGLLTLMTMCGLMIPVDDGSKIALFGKVLADIGDEQSIEQSLSTFSSHMVNIISILGQAGKGSLILLDELGAGTDPVEGAALAMAILMRLREQGAMVAATTHYAELKSYALETEGVENACCEFDVATLQPTYRLLVGVPGRSNAFAISQRLGLDEGIVDTARQLISDENLRFEKVVESLDKARQAAEAEQAEATRIRSELAESRKSASQRLEQLNRERDKILDAARKEARRLIDSARADSNRLINELEDLRRQANKSRDVGELARKAKAAAKSGLNAIEAKSDPVDKRIGGGGYKLPRPLKAGDQVLLADINKEATVLSPPDSSGQVLVLAGIIKTRVPVENLRLRESSGPKKPTGPRNVRTGGAGRYGVESRAQRSAAMELDLRGQSADEGILELDRFIDNALMAGMPSIVIIHGKGTGVLREAVRQHLRRHRNIRSFRPGVYGEGEDGVTIAELK